MKTGFIIAAILVAAVTAGQWTVQRNASVRTKKEGLFYRVTRVCDGDTIKLDNGERVRLIGIDTPESHENPKLERDVRHLRTSKNVLLAMGRQASDFSRDLLLDKDVRLEFDVEQRDRYQRLLAYVYLADGTFVNEKIIREGYAYPLTVPPNVRFADQFKQWFDEAREEKKGLWGNQSN